MTEAKNLFEQGTQLLDSDPQAAYELLSQAAQLDPKAAGPVHNSILALIYLERVEEGMALLTKLENIAAPAAKELRAKLNALAAPFIDIGNVAVQSNDWDEAMSAYRRATVLDPGNADAWVGQGIVFFHLEKNHEALAAFDTALKIDPANYYAYMNRADHYFEAGFFEAAAADYEKASGLDSECELARQGKAAALAKLKSNRG